MTSNYNLDYEDDDDDESDLNVNIQAQKPSTWQLQDIEKVFDVEKFPIAFVALIFQYLSRQKFAAQRTNERSAGSQMERAA